MKYRNEDGTFSDIYFKATDTLPIGTEIDYEGETIPDGWEAVTGTPTTQKIRKKAQVVGVVGNVKNSESTSEKDTYSCSYLNDMLVRINVLTTGSNIDNLTSVGFNLYAVSNAAGTLPTGYTSTNKFIIQSYLTGSSSNLSGKQILMDANSDKLFVRNRNGATWGSWVEINTNINISSGTANPSGGNNGDIYFKYS